MAEADGSYQNKSGQQNDDGGFYLRADGSFTFYDVARTGNEIRNFMRSQFTHTLWSVASVSLVSGANVSTPPTLTPAYGYHTFKCGILMSKGSINIQAASLGDMLFIDGGMMGSDTSLYIVQTGINAASIYTRSGSRASSILMGVGVNSIDTPRIKMICVADGQWSVVETSGKVTVQGE